jgi:hypothetical protein
MKRFLILAACCLHTVSGWSLPQGGGFLNIGKDEGETTLEQWFSVDSHWSAAAQLPGVWADVQGSPNTKQTNATGNVFGVPASRALVERDAQGVIVAVVVEFDPTKQAGGVAALVKRLTTSVGVYQGNSTWTARLNDKVNVGKTFTVTLHQEKNLVSLHLAKAG